MASFNFPKPSRFRKVPASPKPSAIPATLTLWKATIRQAFPEEKQAAALNVLGLFVLHQFRHITPEEVLAMLNFDLMETQAGQQVFEKGRQTGLLDGLQQGAQEMLLEALGERFNQVTGQLVQQIQAIDQPTVLKQLLKPALRCQTLEEFQELLVKLA